MNGEDGRMDLATFLLARIAEDEAVAQAAVYSGAWSAVRNEPDLVWEVHCEEWGHMVTTGYVGNHDSKVLGEHMARYDPARVLAECEAKRQMVQDHTEYANDMATAPSNFAAGRLFMVRLALARLASVYSDHPDYDESWRP